MTLEWAITDPPLGGVCFVSESLGWASGGRIIWRTRDGGTTWEPNLVEEELDMLAVQFMGNGQKGWAIGTQRLLSLSSSTVKNVLFTTEDGGDTWESVSQIQDSRIYMLHFASNTNGCIGSDQLILCSNDGGRSWSKKIADSGLQWVGLHFLSDGQHGWAWARPIPRWAGARPKRDALDLLDSMQDPPQMKVVLFSTADGGLTWNAVGQLFTGNLSALKFSTERNGWALVNNKRLLEVDETVTSQLLYTSDGGTSWTNLTEELSGGFTDFQFDSDGQHGWMIGKAASNSLPSVVLYTQDAGKSWSSKNLYHEDYPNHLYFLPGTRIGWMVGSYGSLLHSQDGINWVPRTRPTVSTLVNIRFAADGQNGWAFASEGAIVHTRDAGVHWERQYFEPSVNLLGLTMDDQGRQGWAIGSGGTCSPQQLQVLHTYDGGNDWTASCVEVGYPVSQGYLNPNGKGWAFLNTPPKPRIDGIDFGPRRFLMFTSDYGRSWQVQYTFHETDVPDVAFFTPDASRGWILTAMKTLLRSNDSGQTWSKVSEISQAQSIDSGFFINALTFMSDGQQGWAAGGIGDGGSNGLVLHTKDGGESWQRQKIEKGFGSLSLQSVTFLPDGLRGWATASKGRAAYTSDGGENWQVQTVPAAEVDLDAGYFITDKHGIHGWLAGKNGMIIRSVGAKTHPILDKYQVFSLSTGVELKWHLAVAPAPAWKPENLTWQIEYCLQKHCTDDTWQKVFSWQSLNADADGGSNVFTYNWDPADKAIAPGTQISYRIGVYDGNQHLAPQELGAFTYQPLWTRLAGWQRGSLIGIAIIFGYVCICFVLLGFYPAALLWLHERLSLSELLEPWAPVQMKPWLPTTLSFVPWFAQHRRVHKTWVKHYLATENARLSDLSASIRKHYLKQDASLDAWVTKHLPRARKLFLQLPTVAQRTIHVLMPIQIESEDWSTLITNPQPKDFRPFMEAPRVFLNVVGIGGAGKSSLACQLSHWAMRPVEEQRLASHCMIPILIGEDTTDLSKVIKERLAIIAGDDLPEGLLENLLSRKRLLVVIDALSEKSKEMQDHVSTIYSTCSAEALVITTRRPVNILGATPVSLRPQEITVDLLAYFLLEYLRYSGRENLFPRRKALELAHRLLTIAEADGKDLPLTPLLIVLFANQAIRLAETGKDMTQLPVTVPETMIDYIKQLNINKRLPERDLIDATLALARQSLGNNYIPHEFERRKAVSALTDQNLWSNSYDLLQELADCGILEQRESAGTTLYRFRFDPVAEYMAAVERVRTLGDDKEAWEQWSHKLKGTEGYPKRMEGFVAALEVCIATYQREFNLPII
jgi:photosystem II stability/assembly factor-like uncharacterized protein